MTSLSDNPTHRIKVTLLDMAKHARDSAHLHSKHGDLDEAVHWLTLAEMWERRVPVSSSAFDSLLPHIEGSPVVGVVDVPVEDSFEDQHTRGA